MLFKITVEPMEEYRHSTGLGWRRTKKKPASMFAVGDTFKGWLSEQRTWQVSALAERKTGHYGLFFYRTEVLERDWNGVKWNLVCSGSSRI
jgi:hypothetical protein